MSLAFIIFLCCGVWHFVYEGIILPFGRICLRNQLFKIRDRLRQYQIAGHVHAENHKAWVMVHDSTNWMLTRLHQITLSAQSRMFHELQKDENLQKRVLKRMAVIESCTDPSIQQAYQEARKVVGLSFALNMGAWAIYVFPIFLFFLMFRQIRRVIQSLVAAPACDADRLVPNRETQYA